MTAVCSVVVGAAWMLLGPEFVAAGFKPEPAKRFEGAVTQGYYAPAGSKPGPRAVSAWAKRCRAVAAGCDSYEAFLLADSELIRSPPKPGETPQMEREIVMRHTLAKYIYERATGRSEVICYQPDAWYDRESKPTKVE